MGVYCKNNTNSLRRIGLAGSEQEKASAGRKFPSDRGGQIGDDRNCPRLIRFGGRLCAVRHGEARRWCDNRASHAGRRHGFSGMIGHGLSHFEDSHQLGPIWVNERQEIEREAGLKRAGRARNGGPDRHR